MCKNLTVNLSQLLPTRDNMLDYRLIINFNYFINCCETVCKSEFSLILMNMHQHILEVGNSIYFHNS